MQELDTVRLIRDHNGVPAGTEGVVVHVYEEDDHPAEVEVEVHESVLAECLVTVPKDALIVIAGEVEE